MIFVELVTDAFVGQVNRIGQSLLARSTGKTSVRRPLRGIELKEDTHAYIKLVNALGIEIPMFDSGTKGGVTSELSNFMLRSVSDQRMERNQVIETFGDSYVFFFGEAPRFLQVQATLLDTLDFQWRNEFMKNYEEYLRGTKAIERGARTYLFYNDNIIEGYILNCAIADSAEPMPYLVDMQFQFFVTKSSSISFVGEGKYPVRASAVFPNGVAATEAYTDQTLAAISRQMRAPAFRTDNPSPLRSYFEDNVDEWTNGRSSEPDAPRRDAVEKRLSDIPDLNGTVGDVLSAYGADRTAANSPVTAEKLGFAPNFSPSGVGAGTSSGSSGGQATFSPTANNLSTPGGYSGTNLRNNNSAFGETYAGVGGSTREGAYAARMSEGSRLGAGAEAPRSTSSSSLALAGSGVGASGGRNDESRAPEPSNAAYARSDAYDRSYATEQLRQSALAGGYSGSNSFLNSPTTKNGVGASNPGNSGGGPTVNVPGQPTAFTSDTIPGSLANAHLPLQMLMGF